MFDRNPSNDQQGFYVFLIQVMVLTQANNGNLTWVAIAIGQTAQSVTT
ncbi:hypothetical protein BSPWISOXPB_8557 [uncultured Gammaproteobacteria bacterium]|nr:hypothetical protein BSPWISOXPB_8557 [uncultured Gammaproteobacteria bacterium]